MIISLADFKAWMKIDTNYTDDDDVINAIIAGVDQAIKNYCETTFEEQTVLSEIHDAKNSDMLVLRNAPITSVQEIRFGVNTSGTDGEAIDPSEYEVRENYVVFQVIYTGTGRSRIGVDYTWGYATVPADVTLAAKLASEAQYRRWDRKAIGMASRSKKDESESAGGDHSAWDSKTGLPKEVVSMLAHYRSFEMPVMTMAQRSI